MCVRRSQTNTSSRTWSSDGGPRQGDDWVSTYPRLDESFDRLRQADWSVGEAGGATVWFVTGTNGETMIKAEGRTQVHRGSGQGFQGLQGECGHQPGTRRPLRHFLDFGSTDLPGRADCGSARRRDAGGHPAGRNAEVESAMSAHTGLGWMLLVVGLVLAGVGLVWILVPSIPWLGRLPGDIRIERLAPSARRRRGLNERGPKGGCIWSVARLKRTEHSLGIFPERDHQVGTDGCPRYGICREPGRSDYGGSRHAS